MAISDIESLQQSLDNAERRLAILKEQDARASRMLTEARSTLSNAIWACRIASFSLLLRDLATRWHLVPTLMSIVPIVAAGVGLICGHIALRLFAAMSIKLLVATGFAGSLLGNSAPVWSTLGAILTAVIFAGLAAFVMRWILVIPETATLMQQLNNAKCRIPELREATLACHTHKHNVACQIGDAYCDVNNLRKSLQVELQSWRQKASKLYAENWLTMRDTEFEFFVERVFTNLQYKVQRTPLTGDQGVDLVVTWSDNRIAVQVKGWAASVGNSAIQEVFAGRLFYKCNACCVVTNSDFTPSARALAKATQCLLIDRENMHELIHGKIIGRVTTDARK